ncbi:MAG: uracil-DNA glycosylase [Wenzhouxiangellaceae bacterium]
MTDNDRIKLEASWKERLQDEFAQPYMKKLRQFLLEQGRKGVQIYPRGQDIFAALDNTPFEQVRAVIIGQDPYHGPRQAHGLCFSVQPGIPTPPSLQNIYKELNSDLGCAIPQHGYLMDWARQGVLLLNAVLTVERGRAGSHGNKGWEQFTDRIIALLNEQRDHLVFLLWGSYAQRKGAMIDKTRHLVLKAPHPSPLSAHRGFLGCQHFSQTNQYLLDHGLKEIDWCLPERASIKQK